MQNRMPVPEFHKSSQFIACFTDMHGSQFANNWFATGASVGASAFGGQDLQPLLRSHRNW